MLINQSRKVSKATIQLMTVRLMTLSIMGMMMFACQSKSASTHIQTVTAEVRADQLIIKAWEHESTVTKVLKELSKKYNAHLKGLEHRLKTRSSTIRKLKKEAKKKSIKDFSTLMISDVLRYTFEIKDEPAGQYVQSIKSLLSILATKGFQAKKIKNYWPKGDNYSGVNMILVDQKGFEWELQVHTPESFAESKRSHNDYEKLRSDKTSLQDRQALFDKMAQPWETIAIPQDVLTPKSLHEIEEIKSMSKPTQ